MSDSEGAEFTNLELQVIIDTYKKQKEYRRIYYQKKYHSDAKHKKYVQSYNKERYENILLDKNILKGELSLEQCETLRANRLLKWYIERDWLNDFKEKYPIETILLDLDL